MNIVHASPEDARAVAEIHVNTWRSAYASILPADYLASLSVERREAMWSEYIASGAPELLVAKDNGVVHGWLSFGASRDEGSLATDAEVFALYVSSEFWSTGTGRMPWLRAKEFMREQHFLSCRLWVLSQNARAIRFYQAAGFVRDQSPSKNIEIGGLPLQEVRYARQLDGTDDVGNILGISNLCIAAPNPKSSGAQ